MQCIVLRKTLESISFDYRREGEICKEQSLEAKGKSDINPDKEDSVKQVEPDVTESN